MAVLCLAPLLLASPGLQAQSPYPSDLVTALPITGLAGPYGVAVDRSGNIFIADSRNNAVKEALAAGGYTTVATLGSGFASPNGVAVDGNGDVFVADTGNNAVKEIVAAGGYSTIVTLGSGFQTPYGVAVDAGNNVFVADSGNNAVKEILASGNYVTVNTLGSGFSYPTSVSLDSSDNVFVADFGNYYVKEILAASNYTTVNTLGDIYIADPISVAVDANDNVYVADAYGNAVKEILVAGGYNTILEAGLGFMNAAGVAVDSQGNVVASDSGTNTISRLMTQGTNFGSNPVGTSPAPILPVTFVFPSSIRIDAPVVTTFGAGSSDFADAGTGDTCTVGFHPAGDTCIINVSFAPSLSGYREGAVTFTDNSGAPAATAYVYGTGTAPQITFAPAADTTLLQNSNIVPTAVVADGAGNLFYADSASNSVAELLVSDGYAAPHTVGSGFNAPSALALDGAGNLFVADTGNNAIKELLATGGYATVLQLGSGFSGPKGVAVSGGGNVFVADSGNGAIKEIPAVDGYLSTNSVGSGFTHPFSIAVDAIGNLFISDSGDIKELLATGNYATTNTLASGIGASSAIALDSNDDLFVSDPTSNTVSQILATGGYATVSTVGSGFSGPSGIAVEGNGNILVADKGNHAIKLLDTVDPPELNFSNTTSGSTSSDSPKTVFVTNVGNQDLTFPLLTSGSNPAITPGFTLSSSSTCPVASQASGAGVLLAGTSCTDFISFSPNEVGQVSGKLVLTDNELNASSPSFSVQNILLNGYGSSETPTFSFSVANQVYGNPPFMVSATSTSPGVITYAVVSGPATISGNVVTLTGAGNVTLQASQAASGNYSAGTALATFLVAQATASISFSVANQTYGTPPFTVSATSNSPGALTYSVVSGPATISGNTVTLTGAGSVTLQASQAATTNYAAGIALATFAVSQANPGITFSVANQVYGNPPFVVAATSNSSGAFTYSVVSGPATISGNIVTLTGAGSVTLQASQAASTSYTAGTALASFVVSKAAPTVAFAVANQTYGNPSFTVAATSNSPGTFTYAVVSGPATISGNVVTLVGAGSVTLQASEVASANYNAGSALATFLVSPATPTIAFSVANQAYGNPPFTVTATSNSPGAFTYSVVSGPATISGNRVTLTGAGSVTLQAAQAATPTFSAASATATFLVAEGLTIAATPASASVSPSGSVDFTLSVSPGAGMTFPNPIQLTATGLPSGATAVFSPSSIAAGASSTQVKMTIQTTIAVAREQHTNGHPLSPIAFGVLLLPLFSRKRFFRFVTRRPALLLLAALSFVTLLAATGCGSGIAARNQQFTIAVSATDAVSGASASTSVNLFVK